ncbi:hypothetical protein BH09DEP1_BH09DEP1_7810 [soil metagenome]
MNKIALFSLSFLLAIPSFSLGQKPPLKAYIKPTLKGLGALALFWTSYQTGRLTYCAIQSFPDGSHTPSNVGVAEFSLDMLGALFSLSVGVPSGIACASTGALGAVLVRSAYKDIKKMHRKI